MNWQRVTKTHPCAVCGKPDWCLIAPRRDVVLCMRVVSKDPFVLKTGEEGYFHNLAPAEKLPHFFARKPPEPEPVINVGKMMEQWQSETPEPCLNLFAEQLGVGILALRKLGCAWAREHRAWAFPNRDGWGEFTGISLRAPSGFKWMVPGSHISLFQPKHDGQKLALVCEGASDTAAALTMGFFAVGRHNASSGAKDIPVLFRRLGVTSAVLITDNDEIGSRGGVTLQQHLRIRSALLVLPAKDLRDFVRLGGTRELLEQMIGQLVWEAR